MEFLVFFEVEMFYVLQLSELILVSFGLLLFHQKVAVVSAGSASSYLTTSSSNILATSSISMLIFDQMLSDGSFLCSTVQGI